MKNNNTPEEEFILEDDPIYKLLKENTIHTSILDNIIHYKFDTSLIKKRMLINIRDVIIDFVTFNDVSEYKEKLKKLSDL